MGYSCVYTGCEPVIPGLLNDRPSIPSPLSVNKFWIVLAALLKGNTKEAFNQLKSYPSTYKCLSPSEQEKEKTRIKICPVCLGSNTTIQIMNGTANIKNIQVGSLVWSMDKKGTKVLEPVIKISSRKIDRPFQIIHLVLEDKRNLWVSPDHPTINGIPVKQLITGEIYDGSTITSLIYEAYTDNNTYDILPAGETGFYWANGILMGSTLK